MLIRALGVEGAAREMVAEAFLTAGRGASLELSPDIRSCLEALVEREIRLGIVCDVGFTGGELLRGFLDRKGLLEHFSGWGFSDEVVTTSPHRKSSKRPWMHSALSPPKPRTSATCAAPTSRARGESG